MHVEFMVSEWLTLYFWPLGSTVNRQPLHDLSRRVIYVPVKFQLFVLKTVRMHVEFTFFGWLTLYFWPLWGGKKRQPFHNLSRGVIDVPVKFQLFILKTVRMHVEFTFFEWLTLYFWPHWGTVESSTPPRPVPGSQPYVPVKVSTLRLENCENACRIHGFWVINPLFLTPLGER